MVRKTFLPSISNCVRSGYGHLIPWTCSELRNALLKTTYFVPNCCLYVSACVSSMD